MLFGGNTFVQIPYAATIHLQFSIDVVHDIFPRRTRFRLEVCLFLFVRHDRFQRLSDVIAHPLGHRSTVVLVAEHVHEATNSTNILLALLKDADLVLDARLAEFVDTHTCIDHARIADRAKEVAMRCYDNAILFSLRMKWPPSTMLDQIVVDNRVESEIRQISSTILMSFRTHN